MLRRSIRNRTLVLVLGILLLSLSLISWRSYRDARHEIEDLNVTSQLRGDFAAAHLAGDNSHVVPTDTQKNTIFAFARDGIAAEGTPNIEQIIVARRGGIQHQAGGDAQAGDRFWRARGGGSSPRRASAICAAPCPRARRWRCRPTPWTG